MCAKDSAEKLAVWVPNEPHFQKQPQSLKEAISFILKTLETEHAIQKKFEAVLRNKQIGSMIIDQNTHDTIARSRRVVNVYGMQTLNNQYINGVDVRCMTEYLQSQKQKPPGWFTWHQILSRTPSRCVNETQLTLLINKQKGKPTIM